MKLKYLQLLLLVFLSGKTFSQSIELHYANLPLNEILIDLNQRFKVQVSIDASLAADCEISIKGRFGSMKKVMVLLSKKCNLDVKKIGDVYTFRPKKGQPKEVVEKPPPTVKKTPQYLYQGVIKDSESGEPLPFTKVHYDGSGVIADENGRFSFKLPVKEKALSFKYLGYVVRDSTVENSKDIEIKLDQTLKVFEAIEVVNKIPERLYRRTVGGGPGHITLNDVATKVVPGNGNNMIFNHLRLYPGIMAAGESTSDFIVWGSYPGQGQIIYDGITLFSGSGINDDIGRVNPLMIKNIQVFKAGYNVDVGDRIGGIMLIDAKKGSRDSVHADINLNNQVAAGRISIPMFKGRSSLQLSGRQSYYDFLDFKKTVTKGIAIIVPEYQYGDFNLKFSTKIKGDDLFEVSTIFGKDSYSQKLDKSVDFIYASNLELESYQWGVSARYSRQWKSGGASSLNFAHSHLNSTQLATYTFGSGITTEFESDYWTNGIKEYSAKFNHSFATVKRNKVDLSLAYIRNEFKIALDSNDNELKNTADGNNRISFYAKDKINVAKWLLLELGFKGDFLFRTLKIYPQPRAKARVKFSDQWQAHLAWGMYNQFVGQSVVLDDFGNQSTIWQSFDEKNAPVLSSMHNVAGISHLSDHFEMGIEGFYKTTEGMSRYVADPDSSKAPLLIGNAMAYGMDVFTKVRLKKHEIWASYSMSQVLEDFAPDKGFNYVQAAHSQLHEFKGVVSLNFHPIYFTTTYVYGSGFLGVIDFFDNQVVPYHRLDATIQGRFNIKRLKFETGISVLNILNRKNIRLNRYARFPDGSFDQTLGIPFTPTIYLNMRF